MGEPNISAIKDRIIEMIKADTDIYDESNPSDTKLNTVRFGMADGGVFNDSIHPSLFVTNDDDLEDDKPFGPIQNNAMGISDHTLRFKLVLFDHGSDAAAVERKLDSLYKRIKENLKGNNELRKPSDDTDPLCTESYPRKGKTFSASFRGQEVDGVVILFVVRVHV